MASPTAAPNAVPPNPLTTTATAPQSNDASVGSPGDDYKSSPSLGAWPSSAHSSPTKSTKSDSPTSSTIRSRALFSQNGAKDRELSSSGSTWTLVPGPEPVATDLTVNDNGAKDSVADSTPAHLDLPLPPPYLARTLTAVHILAFLASLITQAARTGGPPLAISPVMNYLLGPSPETLILLGARFTPCMRFIPTLLAPTTATSIPCTLPTAYPIPQAPGYYQCTWADLCGLFGASPNQWIRVVTAMALHSGLVHLVMNLAFQHPAIAFMEREWGVLRTLTVYVAAGTFGFAASMAVTDTMYMSVGASGALYGIMAVMFVSLVQNWDVVDRPKQQAAKMVGVMLVSATIAVFAAIDQVAHTGGFVVGGLVGVAVMPNTVVRVVHDAAVGDEEEEGMGKGVARKATYVVETRPMRELSLPGWVVRVAAVGIAVTLAWLAVSTAIEGTGREMCPWCKYLTCLPVLQSCP
ncbi:hypothetical protein AMAG_05200 [Allomyces macrogynus ATCC 38327]|uniref:Rhomboid-type serine protease n=1 Tax=Allomyces macrogynus (strain ATCC 38327) TaxID=578462 RepID=A0A0L0SBG4_ALLM3|nr:hypothetical protein AMAG_05200 [Allomyces macrogynus ATCC 38327]|eukprot:KNE59735.1 hypothetical protein AMAG_05200 [Allomyces macrogynus ATCC 38327]